LLGEGPWWSPGEQALYWVDIKNPAILRYRYRDGGKDIWQSPQMIGAFAPRSSGGYIGAFKSGIHIFELSEAVRSFSPVPFAIPGDHGGTDRFNDAKCHPDGSFWAGTMDDAETDVRGWFYRLDSEGALERKHGPFAICNGPAFDGSGRMSYFTDSARRVIFRQDFVAGADSQLEEFARFPDSFGYPDGMTVDADGRLWVAFWDGAKVACLTSSGELAVTIDLPVQRPTSCAFGGPGMDRLYVTSASIGLDVKEAQDGGLWEVELEGAVGLPLVSYRG
jgi:sugar lactone lactonase YvrE